eukprot:GEMP01074680.1.p1 GENE.GEMP01074680.1~~GEMP01074680.1.p1  ORF type:complete len:248 (+),score=51.03 GEMP01074680.1:107-850(+)
MAEEAPAATGEPDEVPNDAEPETAKPTALEVRQQILNELYADVPTSKIKYIARNAEARKEDPERKELVYAEVPLDILDRIFCVIRENSLLEDGGVFVDLGAGAGKCVFSASLYFAGTSCVGIECIPELHAVSKQLLEKFKPGLQEKLPEEFPRPDIDFINGDFADELPKLENVRMVVMFSTLFTQETLNKIMDASKLLPIGSLLVSFTSAIPKNDLWELLHMEELTTSWGTLTYFLYRKLKLPEEQA